MIVVNPKEYFQQFENLRFNKKHKGVRKNSPGMKFKNYANHILFFNDHENLKNCKVEKHEQQRFQIKNTKMVMMKIRKSTFAQLNDKRFYFSDGIVFLHFLINY